MLQRILILVFILPALLSCDGGFKLTGTVYEKNNSIGVPIDSVSIRVIVSKDWSRGQTFSDSNGRFFKAGLSTPFKAPYYFIFEKNGYKTDTVFKQGSRGHSEFVVEHFMVRNR